MQPSEEIKSKLDIVDIIGEYIKLTSAGSNYKANCPFHREKSPSFMVSADKQIWRCFGCAKGGDIFAFVMDIESLDFREALKLLAGKAGVTLKKTDPKISSHRNRLLDILDISARFYQKILLNSSLAKMALEYISARGLDMNMIEEWGIGYSPDSWDDLYLFLKKRGFCNEDILDSGMIIKKDKGYGYYNRFRDRIMFPIKDLSGNIVAFTARINPGSDKDEKMGKYINSPQTIIYNKSNIIFGLDKAKLHIKNDDLIIVAEGQMDVITAHTRGFKNIIASSGTALTKEQIMTLKRYSNNITLAFDKDTAGKMAAMRAIDEALKIEMNVSIVDVPFGKDPDDCIKNNPKEWQDAVKKRIPVMEFYFKEYLDELDLSLIENKRKAVKNILPKIYKVKNNIEKDFWLKKLSNLIDVKEELLRETLGTLGKSENAQKFNLKQNQEVKEREVRDISRDEKLSRQLIGIIIKHPYLIELAINKVPMEYISNKKLQSLYNNILIYYNSNINVDLKIFYKELRIFIEAQKVLSNLELLDILAMESEKIYQNYSDVEAKDEFLNITIFLKKQFLSSEMKKIERLIIEAEQKNDKESIVLLLDKFKILSSDLKSV